MNIELKDSAGRGLELKDIKHKTTLENIKKYNIDISNFDSLLSLRDFIHKLKVKDYQELHKDQKKEYEKIYMRQRYLNDEDFRKQKSLNSSKYNKKKRLEKNNGQIRKPGRPKKILEVSSKAEPKVPGGQDPQIQ